MKRNIRFIKMLTNAVGLFICLQNGVFQGGFTGQFAGIHNTAHKIFFCFEVDPGQFA